MEYNYCMVTLYNAIEEIYLSDSKDFDSAWHHCCITDKSLSNQLST